MKVVIYLLIIFILYYVFTQYSPAEEEKFSTTNRLTNVKNYKEKFERDPVPNFMIETYLPDIDSIQMNGGGAQDLLHIP